LTQSFLVAAISVLLACSACGTNMHEHVWVYDADQDNGYDATVISHDSEHATILFDNGNSVPVALEDCPEYDVYGNPTGRRLRPSACREVNGFFRDSSGREWIIDDN